MRITGGKACGIPLRITRKGEMRPATDAVREKIFNRIAALSIKNCDHNFNYHGKIQSQMPSPSTPFCFAIDCFAGTGAYGLEALSRGFIDHITFFEKSPDVVKNLQTNVKNVCKSARLDCAKSCQIICTDVFFYKFENLYAFYKEKCPNFIFFDPPYILWDGKSKCLFQILKQLGKIFPNAILVIEHPSQLIWPTDCIWQPKHPFSFLYRKNEPQIDLFFCINSRYEKND